MTRLADRPKILLVSNGQHCDSPVCDNLRDHFEVVDVESPLRALAHLNRDTFDGVYVAPSRLSDLQFLGQLVQNQRILQHMPDGVVVLDTDNRIVLHNARMSEWCQMDSLVGENFYSVLDNPEILGPDYCPFHTALSTSGSSTTTLRVGENQFLQIHVAPIIEDGEAPRQLIVSIRDVTTEYLQQQKLAAIHQAGIELADLSPQDLVDMSVEDRKELLKSNILHFTQDLLNFDVVEIRKLDVDTGKLSPLLTVGMNEEAANRELYAQPNDYGVTGFVAATGKSYLCEDTVEDPLYLAGATGAKSSLTVPLILHDNVVGTFNVESTEPRAFQESDLQFLEIFSRDVAVALNTLELLSVEKASSTVQSVEAIHTAVALPIDDILNEAVNVMERYIGLEPKVVERLERILRNARDIKQVIQKVGQTMAPSEAVPDGLQASSHSMLASRRILVADADESVRSAAHALLERYGCIVETAHDGTEALSMVRNISSLGSYDVAIADIRLPDMNGYELLLKLQDLGEDAPPLVLMTGFGYDPGHAIVKARQAGLKEVLYKPFRLDQLLETVERVLTEHQAMGQS